jgi:hypothetical protein
LPALPLEEIVVLVGNVPVTVIATGLEVLAAVDVAPWGVPAKIAL